MAARSVWRERRRSAMAGIGVAVGVAAMIAMVAVGEGCRASISERIRSMGTDLVVVTAGQVKVVAGRPRQTGNVTSLRLDDVRGMSGELPSVKRVAPAQSQKMALKWSDVSTQTTVIGTTPDYAEIRNALVAQGRYSGEDELRGALRVVVLGPTAAENAFGTSSPIGETLRVQRVPYPPARGASSVSICLQT